MLRCGCAIMFGVLVLLPMAAFSQPIAWATHRIDIGLGLRFQNIYAINLGTGERVLQLSVPDHIRVGSGALTRDGQFYLVATSAGVARIRVTTRAFEGFFGPAIDATGVLVSASGQWIHVLASNPNRYYTLSAATGAVVAERCCFVEPISLAFSPDGSTRFEVERRFTTASEALVRAYPDAPAAAVQWQTVVAGSWMGPLAAAGSNDLILGMYRAEEGTSVVVLNARTGMERHRSVVTRLGGFAVRDNVLFVSSVGPPPGGLGMESARLLRTDLTTLATTVLTERSYLQFGSSTGPRDVVLSSDGSVAYWLQFTSLQGLTVSNTTYFGVDTATGDIISDGFLGSRQVGGLAIESGLPCRFDISRTASVPPEGGVVDVPITARGPCLPWSAQAVQNDARIANPGPHSGSTTLRIVVLPTFDLITRTVSVYAAGRTIGIQQPGALPPAPEITGAVIDGRIVLRWTVMPGAGVSSFVVRGGALGGQLTTLATLLWDARSWTSELLPPGSYQVEVASRTLAGTGQFSAPLRFSIGILTRPDPPVNLAVMVAEDVVRITWQAASTLPAPAAYLVEAAPSGASAFAAVARVDRPELIATRVPPGSWQVRVRAMTDGGAGAPSPAALFTTTRCAAAPGPPVDLSVRPPNRSSPPSPPEVTTLRWALPAFGGAEDFIVEAGSAPGARDLGRFRVGSPVLVFEAPAPAGLYYARVRALNACGESPPSNEVIVYVP